MQALLLKVAATVLTLGTAAAAALHVSSHVKSSAAPLHPGVVQASRTSLPAFSDGRLRLSPAVRGAKVETVTSTYAS